MFFRIFICCLLVQISRIDFLSKDGPGFYRKLGRIFLIFEVPLGVFLKIQVFCPKMQVSRSFLLKIMEGLLSLGLLEARLSKVLCSPAPLSLAKLRSKTPDAELSLPKTKRGPYFVVVFQEI